MVVKKMESYVWGFFLCNTDPFCNELIKLSKPQTTLPLLNRPENKKDNCSNLVIWTSNMTNIRMQSCLLLVTKFCYLTNKETAKDECVITFLDNFIFSGCHP